MISVLGKRTRQPDLSLQCKTRAKRQSRLIEVHHDTEEPVSCRDVPDTASKETAGILDAFHVTTPRTASRTRPSKHERTPQIGAHFKVVKSGDDTHPGQKKCGDLFSTPKHGDRNKKILVTPRHYTASCDTREPATEPTRSVFDEARQLFSGACQETLLVGRHDEREQVTNFIESHMRSNQGGCLYISGPPGTGKSAFVTDIMHRQTNFAASPTIINCMSIKSSADFTRTVAIALGLDAEQAADADLLKSAFLSKAGSGLFTMVLDEIDRLVDLDLGLLYSLFEWATSKTSQLILVGIANALDLTDRLLPRLKSRRIKPDLLPFMPYTAPQINNIISTKLRSLSASDADPAFIPFLQPVAILLCSKKVASQTGDLRKAFDIVKRAITIAESEARTNALVSPASIPSRSPLKTPLSENVNLSSPPIHTPTSIRSSNALAAFTAETAPRATIAHVARVTAQIFSGGTSSRLSQLSIQQKAVLCALAASEKKSRSALANALSSMTSFCPATPSKTGRSKGNGTSSRVLYDSYAELCKRDKILHPLTSNEFGDVLSSLETQSLIESVDAKGKGTLALLTPTRTPSRKSKKADFGQMNLGTAGNCEERKVASVVGFAELRDSLKGPGGDILLDILEG